MANNHHNKAKTGHLKVIENLYNELPAFTDVFDEESFYVFVACFVTGTILLVVILSRYVKIKPLE